MKNLVQVINKDVIVADEAITTLRKLNDSETQPKNYKKEFEKQLKKAMGENGLKSIKNDVFTARYIKRGTRKKFDAEKAKKFIEDCGMVVSDFEKETKVKSSLRIQYK